jgi:hypothetical protein
MFIQPTLDSLNRLKLYGMATALSEQMMRPPGRICIDSAGLNVHLLPGPFSSEDCL